MFENICAIVAFIVCCVILCGMLIKPPYGPAFVEVDENGSTHLHGDAHDIAVMMVACAVALEREGYDMTQVKTAIRNVKRKDGGAEDD